MRRTSRAVEVEPGRMHQEGNWRRGSESNRRIKVLQTSPLPLGYRALTGNLNRRLNPPASAERARCRLERETGLEPATLALARRCSTTELLPLGFLLSISVAFATGQSKLSAHFRGSPKSRVIHAHRYNLVRLKVHRHRVALHRQLLTLRASPSDSSPPPRSRPAEPATPRCRPCPPTRKSER